MPPRGLHPYLAGRVELPGAGGSKARTSCCFWYHSRTVRDRSDTLKSLKCDRFSAPSTSFLSCVLSSDFASSAHPLNDPVLSSSALAPASLVSSSYLKPVTSTSPLSTLPCSRLSSSL